MGDTLHQHQVVLGRCRTHVATCAESATRTAQEQHTDAFIPGGGVDHLEQAARHVVVDRVQLVGTVERDTHDRANAVDQQVRMVHSGVTPKW